jgi:hypothetical protein
VDLVLAQDPDLVALGGDFITIGHQLPNTAAYAAVLAPLARRCPVLAVLGNHEGPRRTPIARYVESVIQRAGGQVLRNNTQRLFVGGRELLFSGLGDLWTNECRPEQCLFPLNEKDESRPAHIVLSHNPDSKDSRPFYDWDLMLCATRTAARCASPSSARPSCPSRIAATSKASTLPDRHSTPPARRQPQRLPLQLPPLGQRGRNLNKSKMID